jgi:site-specific DNA-methyltransferase (adenine-specific)
VTLYHGDCRDLLPHIEADVMVTDPPYGVGFVGKRTKWTPEARGGYLSVVDDESAIAVAVAVVDSWVHRGGRAVVTPGVKNRNMYTDPTHVGVIFYPSGAGMTKWGFTCWQPILYYGADPFLADRQGSRPDSFSSTEAAEPNGHPCPKPIGTMRWLVLRASRASETLLDPFAGSGTTLVAAKNLGRKAIGIEIEERYCEIAARRCAQDVLNLEAAA